MSVVRRGQWSNERVKEESLEWWLPYMARGKEGAEVAASGERGSRDEAA
jgi:hypothetical protein